MLDNISSFKCFSFFFRLSPITKLICSFLFAIFILFLNLPTLFLFFLLFLCFSSFFKNPYPIFLSLSFFISIFIFLFTSFFNFNFFFRFSLFFKIYLFLLSFSFPFMTISFPSLHSTLEKILTPLQKFSIDVSSLAYRIILPFLFLNILIEESNKITKSLKRRNFSSSFPYFTLFKVKMLFKYVLKNSKKRFSEVKENMLLRNFSIHRKRTNYRMNGFCLFDILFCLVYVIITVGIIIREVFL